MYMYLKSFEFRHFNQARWSTCISVGMAGAIPRLDIFSSLVGAPSSSTLALLAPPLIDSVLFWDDMHSSCRYTESELRVLFYSRFQKVLQGPPINMTINLHDSFLLQKRSDFGLLGTAYRENHQIIWLTINMTLLPIAKVVILTGDSCINNINITFLCKLKSRMIFTLQ